MIILIIFGIVIFVVYDNISRPDYPLSLSYLLKIGINEINNILGYNDNQNIRIYNYPKIETNFKRTYKYLGKIQSQRKTLPFAASAAIYIPEKDKDIVFVGMGENQDDILLEYDNKTKTLKKHNW